MTILYGNFLLSFSYDTCIFILTEDIVRGRKPVLCTIIVCKFTPGVNCACVILLAVVVTDNDFTELVFPVFQYFIDRYKMSVDSSTSCPRVSRSVYKTSELNSPKQVTGGFF